MSNWFLFHNILGCCPSHAGISSPSPAYCAYHVKGEAYRHAGNRLYRRLCPYCTQTKPLPEGKRGVSFAEVDVSVDQRAAQRSLKNRTDGRAQTQAGR